MSRTTLTLKTQRRIIGRITEILPDDLSEEDALFWIGHSAQLSEGLRNVLIRSKINWLDQLVQAENNALGAFFNETFDLSQFAATLKQFGEKRVMQWAKLGLKPHFLPRIVFTHGSKFPGWKIKPESWFWQKVADGSIKRRNVAGELEIVKEVRFEGTTVLIDTRCKPAYDGGRQMFANDEGFLGGVIEALRTEGKIAHTDAGPPSSRFNISSSEWDEHIRPALEARPEFEGVTFRLEQTIEANVIPQLYMWIPRKKDGRTNTWVWFEEFFEGASSRLDGGRSDYGGLADVCCYYVVNHWFSGAVRPVGVLDA